MNRPTLWDRIRRARIVQVLIVYLGASWGVLQIAQTLTEALALPQWVAPVSIILLLVGLIIILATAWVQSLPATTAAEDAGERPTDWEVAPADALANLREGKLPHLTWGRAIAGGVIALSLLFGGAGLYVGVTGGPSFIGPEQVGASAAAEGIAIAPFKVTGADLDVWKEGMVDLLSTNLDGMGGYRTIDARTVLARWRETVGDDDAPDLQTSLRAAGRTGARYAVLGSVVGGGNDLRLVTEIYDLSNGREIGSGQVAGSADEIMTLVDELSLETMRLLLAGGGEELASTRNLADLTTASLDALRAYLEGERYYRRAEFPQAVEAYERALEQDSAFALALFRLADTYGWLEAISSDRAVELGAASVEAIDRLTPRNAVIVGASNALYTNDMSFVPQMRTAVTKYPDDPEAWFMLGEAYIHMEEATGATTDDAREVVHKAIELDPSFAPYYIHAIHLAIMRNDREEAERFMEEYRALSNSSDLDSEVLLGFDLFVGDESEKAAALAALPELDDRDFQVLWGTFGRQVDDLVTARRVAEYGAARFGGDGWTRGLARFSVMDGRLDHGEAILRDSIGGGPDAQNVYLHHRLGALSSDDLLDVVRTCDFGAGCTLWRGILAAEEGDWDVHAAAVTDAREAAETLRTDGDPLTARFAEAEAEALEGYADLIRGEPAIARARLERAQGKTNGNGDTFIRLLLAEANFALGRHAESLRWYGLLNWTTFKSHAHVRRAEIAEEIGDTALARAEWAKALMNLGDADEDHQGLLAARAAVSRLGG